MKRCRITSIEIYISVSYRFSSAHPWFRTFYSDVCTTPASEITSPFTCRHWYCRQVIATVQNDRCWLVSLVTLSFCTPLIEREREVGSLLIHTFTPITRIFPLLWVSCILSLFLCFALFFYISCLPFFFSFFPLSPPHFHCARLWPFILPVVTGFAIFTPQPLLACCGCPSKIVHWSIGCPATTTTLCWLCHASSLDKSCFVLSLTSLDTFIQIRVKPLPYQSLQHASSDSSSLLPLLDETSSRQDISPKRA